MVRTARRVQHAGFTLIEVLVAISVLTTMLFVPLSVITQYLTEVALTEDSVKAGLLAQEVIEYVRYDRDSNLLSGDGTWFTRLRSPVSVTNTYSECITRENDWLRGADPRFCNVECTSESETGLCSEVDGFVSGVSGLTTVPVRYPNKTCDGKEAGDTEETFSVTLTIVVPSNDTAVQYASVRPCVSWKDRSGAERKMEIEETLFHWLVTD